MRTSKYIRAVAIVALAFAPLAAHAVDLLDFVEVERDGSGGITGLDGPAVIDLSDDGAHLYVTGIFDNAVVAFERNESTGELTLVDEEIDGVGGVTGLFRAFGVVVSPGAGNHVYVAAQNGSVALFNRNTSTGELTFVESIFDNANGVDGIGGGVAVDVSPDGNHVYVAGQGDRAIAVFSRNTSDGRLTFIESQDDDDGNLGIAGIFWVTVSPDGRNVYGAGSLDNAIGVFSRNETTGRLTFLEAVTGPGLGGASSVKVSPDSQHVYVASTADDALVVFDRDPGDGTLTRVDVESDLFNGIDGLRGAFSTAVAPDGELVYAATVDDSALVVFDRDSTSGTLEFKQVLRDGVDGFDGLSGACGVIVAPGSEHVYAVGFNEDAIPVIRKNSLATFGGSVRDADTGEPVACGVIELTQAGPAIPLVEMTDINGDFMFEGLDPATYQVRVIGVPYADLFPADITLAPGGNAMRNYDLTPVVISGGIQGRVTDSVTGEPLAAIIVEAQINSVSVAMTYTCADGTYAFNNLVTKGGGTIVTANYSGTNYQPATQDILVFPDQVSNGDQDMLKAVNTTASLSGTVFGKTVDSGDVAIAGAQVTIQGQFNGTRTTDANGAYSFNDVVAGNYTIRASAEGLKGESASWAVQTDRASVKNFSLKLNGSVGLIGDFDGNGMVNAVDVQLVINSILGLTDIIDADVNLDAASNAADIQLVINKALGL